MLKEILASMGPSAVQRLTLLVNHVIAGEPAAVARLLVHRGKRLKADVSDWPQFLPTPPAALLRVSPAGLFEAWDEGPASGVTAADLELRIAAPNPAGLVLALARGEQPAVTVLGDAQFAADIQWLADNLRWDLEADLARVVGPLPAHQLATLGKAVRDGLRRWAPPRAGDGPRAP